MLPVHIHQMPSKFLEYLQRYRRIACEGTRTAAAVYHPAYEQDVPAGIGPGFFQNGEGLLGNGEFAFNHAALGRRRNHTYVAFGSGQERNSPQEQAFAGPGLPRNDAQALRKTDVQGACQYVILYVKGFNHSSPLAVR